MLCTNCGNKEANFHYKYMNNDQVSEVHLCTECAKKLGYLNENENPFNFNFGSLFGDFLSIPSFMKTPQISASCPSCKTTFDSIKNTGFVGCDKCYDTFADEIEAILGRIQPGTTHKGRLSGTDGKKIEKENTLKKMKDDLKKAIIDENYEQAAVLRDKIKDFESKEEKKND